MQHPRHPLCPIMQHHSSLSPTCPVPYGAAAPTYPPAWEPPIPSLGESSVPSLGVALGPLVSSQDDCCPYLITCGVPCPILGWSQPEGGASPTWGGRTLRARFPARGGGAGCRLPGGGPAAPRGVTLSPSLSPTWEAGAGPSVRSTGAAGATGRQSRPASPPLPPSSSSSSTSLPPPRCLPQSPGRRRRGTHVFRVLHSPAPDCPTLPKVLHRCPVSSQGSPSTPGCPMAPWVPSYVWDYPSQVFPWTPLKAPHTLRAPNLKGCLVSPPICPGVPVYPSTAIRSPYTLRITPILQYSPSYPHTPPSPKCPIFLLCTPQDTYVPPLEPQHGPMEPLVPQTPPDPLLLPPGIGGSMPRQPEHPHPQTAPHLHRSCCSLAQHSGLQSEGN